MKLPIWILSCSMFLLLQSGCQCTPLYEPYSDLIDHKHPAKHCGPKFVDKLYSPCIDATRIGRADWCCECGLGRFLCHKACRRCAPSPCFSYTYPDRNRVYSKGVEEGSYPAPGESTDDLPNVPPPADYDEVAPPAYDEVAPPAYDEDAPPAFDDEIESAFIN